MVLKKVDCRQSESIESKFYRIIATYSVERGMNVLLEALVFFGIPFLTCIGIVAGDWNSEGGEHE
jgi:hypothetical protein